MLSLINNAIKCEINFSHVIVLLVEDSKIVLSLLQVNFLGRGESSFLLESPNENVCVHVWCIFLFRQRYWGRGISTVTKVSSRFELKTIYLQINAFFYWVRPVGMHDIYNLPILYIKRMKKVKLMRLINK